MTKLWVNNSHTAVTLLEIVPQEVVRYKTSEKDGYEATVIGVGKKELNKEKITGAKKEEIEAFNNTIEELSKFTSKANSVVDKFVKSDEHWFYKTLMNLVK